MSSSTWEQMFRTFRRWENSCSTNTTTERSDSAAQGSSTLFGPVLLFVLLLLSSSPFQGLRMHLGATAANVYEHTHTYILENPVNIRLQILFFPLITYQRADCQRTKVHLDVQTDPVETRQRRVRTGPCWSYPQSESSALNLRMKSWCKSLRQCWAGKGWKKKDEPVDHQGSKEGKRRFKQELFVKSHYSLYISSNPHNKGDKTNLRVLALLRFRVEREEKLLLELM